MCIVTLFYTLERVSIKMIVTKGKYKKHVRKDNNSIITGLHTLKLKENELTLRKRRITNTGWIIGATFCLSIVVSAYSIAQNIDFKQ